MDSILGRVPMHGTSLLVRPEDLKTVEGLKKAAVKYLPVKDARNNHPLMAELGDMDISSTAGESEVDLNNALMKRTAHLKNSDFIPDIETVNRLDDMLNRIGGWVYKDDPDVAVGREIAQGNQPPQNGVQKGVLVLESSGGGGHIAVAKQVVKELEDDGGRVSGDRQSIYRKNVMENYMGKRMTNAMVGPWNKAVREGNVEKQQSMLKKRRIGELIVYLPIFLGTVFTLMSMKTPPKKVITTQPLGLGAILKAVSTYNHFMKARYPDWEPVIVEQKLTDLLTPEAIHFVDPLKSLGEKQRKILTLVIAGEEKDFSGAVKELLGEGFHNVRYTGNAGLPVNELFLSDELADYLPGEAVNIPLDSLSKNQEKLIREVPGIAQCLGETTEEGEGKVNIVSHINTDDHVHQLMLGSMPPEPNVMNFIAAHIYMAQCIEKRGEVRPSGMHVRVLCGRDSDGMPSLFKRACEVLGEWHKNEKDASDTGIPPWLKICPLPFQHPANIAKGGMRAHKYFTRGGGATTMEHIAMGRMKTSYEVAQTLHPVGNISIVGEGLCTSDDPEEMLRNDFPLIWEGGNARFLKENLGASITNKHHFLENIANQYPGLSGGLTKDETNGYEAFLKEFSGRWQEKIERDQSLPAF
ncbi:hypothetical protein [Sansalvadorimonas verongulae]|uniref:hypothetical protein n=1 Tax=Sansalvadorimonas verongulae TaxID=2172824 RepID=UPI0012BCC0EC|nr:hypothetical protein [Sansalvadorimonas verongulae]MTI14289.1 hypothetical protein [Sansalvadorimonas verongulae]